MKNLSKARLYGIIDLGYVAAKDLEKTTQAMLNGGIDIIQLRAKSLTLDALPELAMPLLAMCRQKGTPFIINDHAAIAHAIDADGVHVGQDDLSITQARQIVGKDKIVGCSTHALIQAKKAQAEGADYIGYGPIFSTPTKPDYQPVGPETIIQIHQHITLPIFCIGGIKLDNLPTLLKAGARRVVIVSGILKAENISDYVRACKLAIEDNLG